MFFVGRRKFLFININAFYFAVDNSVLSYKNTSIHPFKIESDRFLVTCIKSIIYSSAYSITVCTHYYLTSVFRIYAFYKSFHSFFRRLDIRSSFFKFQSSLLLIPPQLFCLKDFIRLYSVRLELRVLVSKYAFICF